MGRDAAEFRPEELAQGYIGYNIDLGLGVGERLSEVIAVLKEDVFVGQGIVDDPAGRLRDRNEGDSGLRRVQADRMGPSLVR
jgi:hypothetical protein